MNKQKSTTLLVAGLVSTGLVGATLAYFSSSDSLTNHFTASQKGQGIITVEKYGEVGVEDGAYSGHIINDDGKFTKPSITEGDLGISFDGGYTADTNQHLVYNDDKTLVSVLPGDVINKDMAAFNDANYDQFVKASYSIEFFDSTGNAVTDVYFNNDGTYNFERGDTSYPLTDFVTLNTSASAWGSLDGASTVLVPGEDYYLIEKLASGTRSADLLDSYKLEVVKNGEVFVDSMFLTQLSYKITMNTKSIQATNYPADGYASEGWPALNNGVLDVTPLN